MRSNPKTFVFAASLAALAAVSSSIAFGAVTKKPTATTKKPAVTKKTTGATVKSTTTIKATPTIKLATTSTSASGPAPGPGPGGGTRGAGGPGGGLNTITPVNLNTNGVSPGGANTAEVVKATKSFLGSLDTATLDAVTFDFTENKARQTWSNFPTTTVAREGVSLSKLTTAQRAAVFEILKVALSTEGYQQVLDIQKSDDWLAANSSDGNSSFGNLLYYVAIYGTPSETTPFMIQFGGHHLARMLTYNGDKVSQTPQFVGSEPVTFQLDGKTYEPVKAESTAAFGLLAALSDAHLTAAKLPSGAIGDLVMGPGRDTGVFPISEGILLSELNDAERKATIAFISAYVNDLPSGAATKAMAKYEGELNQTRVLWTNNTTAATESSYVRIDGPSVWIEFINTRSRSTPNIHFHTVYRDKSNDYGSSKPA
jgi:hypothetical protein